VGDDEGVVPGGGDRSRDESEKRVKRFLQLMRKKMSAAPCAPDGKYFFFSRRQSVDREFEQKQRQQAALRISFLLQGGLGTAKV
jgi:hypothetical protein